MYIWARPSHRSRVFRMSTSKYISSLNSLIIFEIDMEFNCTSWIPFKKDGEQAHLAILKGLEELPNLHTINISPLERTLTFPHHSVGNLDSLSLNGYRGSCLDSWKALFDGLARTIAILGPKRPGQLTSLEVSHHWNTQGVDRNESFDRLFKYYPHNAAPLQLRNLVLRSCFVSLDDAVLPHLKHLTSLQLTRIEYPFTLQGAIPVSTTGVHDSSNTERIWTALKEAHIYLKEITVDFVASSFLTYLSSYSGVRKLHVFPGSFDNNQASDTMAQQFFAKPLESHAASLEDLVIEAYYEGFWCFGKHIVPLVSKLENLRNLHIGIISSQLWKENYFKEGAAPQPNPDAIVSGILSWPYS